MAQQADLQAILAALGIYTPSGIPPRNIVDQFHPGRSGSTPAQGQPSSQPPQTYPSAATPSNPLAGIALPQPTSSGNLDLSAIKPAGAGNVSLADAIAKAKGMAAERASARDNSSRNYGRSRSRSPARRDNYRDNYNPFRDERRDDPRRGTNGRDRSATPPAAQPFSPGRAAMQQTRQRSPPPKADNNAETITVESTSVGLIIGRGGENLRRVESETGARVQFITGPEGAGALRQCRISGTRQQRADAKADIYRIVEEHPREQPSRQAIKQEPTTQGHYSMFETETTQKNGDKNIQMMVPDKTVGLIIGRGGETIRDIQERSGCHVNITSESKSINGLRPVNLIGSRAATDEARKLINDVVESDTRAAGSSYQAPPSAQPYPHYPPPQQQAYAPPAYGMPYADPYAAQRPQQHSPYDPSGGDKSTDTIVVPSEAVGMIIGKGGETIKEMQNVTGCKINVAPPSGPDINREIGLIGSRQAIESGKRAIWDKVNAVVCVYLLSRHILLTDLNFSVRSKVVSGPGAVKSQRLSPTRILTPSRLPTVSRRRCHNMLPPCHHRNRIHTQCMVATPTTWRSGRQLRTAGDPLDTEVLATSVSDLLAVEVIWLA